MTSKISYRGRDLTTGQVAKICSVASRTVSKWFDNGFLHGYRVPGGKDRRVTRDELVRFLNEHKMPLTGFTDQPVSVLLGFEDAEQSRLATALAKAGGTVVLASCEMGLGMAVWPDPPSRIYLGATIATKRCGHIAERIKAIPAFADCRIVVIANQEELDATVTAIQGDIDFRRSP